MTVVTRFAPSPTGRLHLGNLRAALLNWALARQAPGGRFLLRFDDTDAERSRPEFVAAIRDDLAWLGLTPDAEFRQSERLDLYRAAAERLKESGRLYPCFETPEELELRRRAQQRAGRPPVYDRAALRLSAAERAALAAERPAHWRFRLESARVRWTDAVQGATEIDAASLSDPVLIRGDGLILYTLASVVDDAGLGVTDVVRGADHVANTAVQIQLFQALGAEPPRFAHHALMTDEAGRPLSKRADAFALSALREAGIEPLALLSLLARLGSADPVETATAPEAAAAAVDLSRLSTSPTRLAYDDVARHSAKTLHALPFDAVAPRLPALGIAPEAARPLWPVVAPNLDRLADLGDWLRLAEAGPDPAALEGLSAEDLAYLATARELLPPRPWTETTWRDWSAACQAASGRRGAALFRPLRLLLTGRARGPEMAALMPHLAGPVPEIPAESRSIDGPPGRC